MYDDLKSPLLPRGRFFRRLAVHAAFAAGLIIGSLLLGMAGYMYFEALHWRDAFLNAAMLLGGMGPVDPPKTDGGKLFAGIYALYAGLVFLVGVGLVFTPVAHRLMHRYHLDETSAEQ
jgi:flagellar biosynthesis protein FliR